MTVAHSPVHSYVHLPVHSHSPVWTLENDSIISGGGEAPLWLKPALLAWILSPELRRYLILKAAVLWTGTSERRLGHNALGWALSQRGLLVHGHLFPASLLSSSPHFLPPFFFPLSLPLSFRPLPSFDQSNSRKDRCMWQVLSLALPERHKVWFSVTHLRPTPSDELKCPEHPCPRGERRAEAVLHWSWHSPALCRSKSHNQISPLGGPV